MSSGAQIATNTAKKEENISILSISAALYLCLHAIFLYQTVSYLLLFFRGLSWYSTQLRDGSRWTRSATPQRGQVSKKPQSKAL